MEIYHISFRQCITGNHLTETLSVQTKPSICHISSTTDSRQSAEIYNDNVMKVTYHSKTRRLARV